MLDFLLLLLLAGWLAGRLPAESFKRARQQAGLEFGQRRSRRRHALEGHAGTRPLGQVRAADGPDDRCTDADLAVAVRNADGSLADAAVALARSCAAAGRLLGWEAMSAVLGGRVLSPHEELCFAWIADDPSAAPFAWVIVHR